MHKSIRQNREVKSSESETNDRSRQFEAGIGFVIVGGPFLGDKDLSDAECRYLIALESWAWEKNNCFPTNASIARRCGWFLPNGRPASDKAQRVGQGLESKNRIKRVIGKGELREVTRDKIVILGRRTSPIGRQVNPTANMPLPPRQNCRPSHGRNAVQSRFIESDSGRRRLSETGGEHPSLRDVTLIDEARRPTGAVNSDVATLRDQLYNILMPSLSDGQKNAKIAKCSKWLAKRFNDFNWVAGYAQNLRQMLAGERTPDDLLSAFALAYAKQLSGDDGAWGAYFRSTADGIRTNRAHDQVEAEQQAGTSDEMARSVSYDDVLADEPFDPTIPDRPPPPKPAAPNSPPKPDAVAQPHPIAAWVEQVRDRVMNGLGSIAGDGPLADSEQVRQIARDIQETLAGQNQGSPSKLFLSLVEAVAFGYEPAIIEAAFAGNVVASAVQPTDIRAAAYNLAPDPRDWLRRNVSEADRILPGRSRRKRTVRHPVKARKKA